MRYAVRHTTTYTYEDPVDLASHQVHLAPRAMQGQTVLSSEIVTYPTPARFIEGEDHFGNLSRWMFMDTAHDKFVVTMNAAVEVDFPPPPPAGTTLRWEEVRDLARRGGRESWRAAEFSFGSPMSPADPAAGAYAARSFPPGARILDGILDLTRRINREFSFRPGATTLSTPVAQVMEGKAGVCQDFSHVMCAGLRWLGLPGRYVSGYIRTRPRPGQKKHRGADVSHAWVSAWLGPDHGWVHVDPTNDLVLSREHVILGWGRDYGDVSPVRGVILGGRKHALTVEVDLDPMQEEFAV